MKTINFNFGYDSYNVVVDAGKSITVCRNNEKPNSFKIGDQAEYDSYNLSYYGEIVAITEKTVTIIPRFETKKKRFKIENFAWRNWCFNLSETITQNAETSYYI